jgi:O-antigen/teichoic acid export membrane protein
LVVTGWIALANLVAAWAFPWLFGNEWGDAIPYLRALSIAYWLQAIVHPFSTTLQLLEHQLTAVLWQIGRLVLLVASIMLAWRHGYSAQTALWFGSSAQAACNLVLLGLTALRVEGVCARRRSAGTQ